MFKNKRVAMLLIIVSIFGIIPNVFSFTALVLDKVQLSYGWGSDSSNSKLLEYKPAILTIKPFKKGSLLREATIGNISIKTDFEDWIQTVVTQSVDLKGTYDPVKKQTVLYASPVPHRQCLPGKECFRIFTDPGSYIKVSIQDNGYMVAQYNPRPDWFYSYIFRNSQSNLQATMPLNSEQTNVFKTPMPSIQPQSTPTPVPSRQ